MSRCQVLCILGKGGSGRENVGDAYKEKAHFAKCETLGPTLCIGCSQSLLLFQFACFLAWLVCLFVLVCFVLFWFVCFVCLFFMFCLLACWFALLDCLLCWFSRWLAFLVHLFSWLRFSFFSFDCSRHVCLLYLFAFSHVFASFTCLFVVLWASVCAVLIWFVWCAFRQVNVEDDSKETQGFPAVLLTNPPYLVGLWNKTAFLFEIQGRALIV